ASTPVVTPTPTEAPAPTPSPTDELLSPEPTCPATVLDAPFCHGEPDLEARLPDSLNGTTLPKFSYGGVPPGPDRCQVQQDQTLVTSLGKTLDDMQSAGAVYSPKPDFLLIAIRIPGTNAKSWLPAIFSPKPVCRSPIPKTVTTVKVGSHFVTKAT